MVMELQDAGLTTLFSAHHASVAVALIPAAACLAFALHHVDAAFTVRLITGSHAWVDVL